MKTLPAKSMKFVKKSRWHFARFLAMGAYFRGVFSSTPYINKEVYHHAGSLQRLDGYSYGISAAAYGCEVAASMKFSPGRWLFKIGGGFSGWCFEVAAGDLNSPGRKYEISAGSFEIAKGGF